MKAHLVVFAKPPLAGGVKTRLAAEIGPARAASFYRLSTGRLLGRLSGDRRWRTVLCANAPFGPRPRCWPEAVPILPQGRGTLGDRMARAIHAMPPGPVLVIGTDTPQIEPREVAAAVAALGSADAVFGPASDGGYWLFGLARRRPAPRLFDGVRWSTKHALADTEASLPERFRTLTLGTKTDVDDLAALRRMRAEWGEVRQGPWAPRSASAVRAGD